MTKITSDCRSLSSKLISIPGDAHKCIRDFVAGINTLEIVHSNYKSVRNARMLEKAVEEFAKHEKAIGATATLDWDKKVESRPTGDPDDPWKESGDGVNIPVDTHWGFFYLAVYTGEVK